jgi:thymidylate synthase
MKNYPELIKHIIEDGYVNASTNGDKRSVVAGVSLRFDLNDGLPIVDKSEFEKIVDEALWYISGSSNVNDLAFRDDNKLTKHSINAVTMEEFKKEVGNHEGLLKDLNVEGLLNTIGTSGGYLVRKLNRTKPATMATRQIPLADDAMHNIAKHIVQASEGKKDFDIEIASKEIENSIKDYVIDQMETLLYWLKLDPHSSKHIITEWLPDDLPLRGIETWKNAFSSRNVLFPLTLTQQYIVSPPKEKGGKNRLSLVLTQRSCDVYNDGFYNLTKMSIVLSIIAHVLGMVPDNVIWNVGMCFIIHDDFDSAVKLIEDEPQVFPKLVLNKIKNTIYSFGHSDITLE